MNSVSKNIRKIRFQKKMTQEEMAEKLFVTRQTVSNWENGKSQPDIDTLVKIADTLNTDTTTLIYGAPDSVDRKKEKKDLIIAAGILLIAGLLLFFTLPYITNLAKTYYLYSLLMLLDLYIYPILWFMVGWVIMHGLSMLGIVRPVRSKYGKKIHITVLVIVLAYAALMVPYLVDLVRSTVQVLQYFQNPSFYNGYFSYNSIIPEFLNNVYWVLLGPMYGLHYLFVFPGILYRLTKPVEQLEANTISNQ
jgi:Predicted transcriptional regulators